MSAEGFYAPFFRYFRSRRMARFVDAFRVTERTRILDVGGTPGIWAYLPFHPDVTFTNLSAAAMGSACGVIADGCMLPFRDGAFDLIFSNSVIEHVGDWAAQQCFAAECRRVGRRYYIQTPDYWFPIEPHMISPFIHWFPRSARERIFPFTLRAMIDREARKRPEDYASIALLTPAQMNMLFPGAQIWRERVLGFTKSLIAVRI
ncbi:MAG: class I SAM-dependent methyltransferase [Candidatus Binataceae bacterium]